MDKGIWGQSSNKVTYDPKSFNLGTLKELVKTLEYQRPVTQQPVVLYTSRKGMWLLDLMMWSQSAKVNYHLYEPVRVKNLYVLSLFKKHGLCKVRVIDHRLGYSYSLYYGSKCYGTTSHLGELLPLIYYMKSQLLKQNIQL
jgi:hypothetical protein